MSRKIHIKILSILLIGLPIVFILDPRTPTIVLSYVTEEKNFVVVRTRDSGSFVGVKEDVIVGGISRNHTTVTTSDLTSSKIYYAFRGIPYAKPPVAKLRWKDPEPPDVTGGLKDATKFKSICSQWDSVEAVAIGSADCLYLNIFTPRLHFTVNRPQSEKDLSPYDEDPRISVRGLSTLVYIHNGDFTSGSGDIEHYERFMDEKTVLVSFNYRLGIFGFLSSGDSEIPGNYGILDQIFALKWIKKNIHRFGGDPSRITIFGAVTSLLLSPLASFSDLYEGVILMESSTSILTSGFISHHSPHEFYINFINSINCPIGIKTEEILNSCLQIRSSEELIEKQNEILQSDVFPGRIGPVVDGNPLRENDSAVFVENPQLTIQSEEFLNRKVPILLGVNTAEGFRIFHKFFRLNLQNLSEPIDEEKILNSLLLAIRSIRPNITHEAIKEIWEYYFPNFQNFQNSQNSGAGRDKNEFNLKMLQLFGDLAVYSANWELLQVLSKKNSVIFNYVFDHSVQNFESYYLNQRISKNDENFPWEEEFYLFSPYNDEILVNNRNDGNIESDKLFPKILVKIWTSFAAYRTPKNALAKLKSWGKWSSFSVESDSTNYYHLKFDSSKMENNFRKNEAEFLNKIFTKVYTSTAENKSSSSSSSIVSNSDDSSSSNTNSNSASGVIEKCDWTLFLCLLTTGVTLFLSLYKTENLANRTNFKEITYKLVETRY